MTPHYHIRLHKPLPERAVCGANLKATRVLSGRPGSFPPAETRRCNHLIKLLTKGGVVPIATIGQKALENRVCTLSSMIVASDLGRIIS